MPDLGGESFQSFTTEYDVSCGVFNLYQLEKVPTIPSFLSDFFLIHGITGGLSSPVRVLLESPLLVLGVGSPNWHHLPISML